MGKSQYHFYNWSSIQDIIDFAYSLRGNSQTALIIDYI